MGVTRSNVCQRVVETHVWTALQRVKIYEPRAPENSPPLEERLNFFLALQHRSTKLEKLACLFFLF